MIGLPLNGKLTCIRDVSPIPPPKNTTTQTQHTPHCGGTANMITTHTPTRHGICSFSPAGSAGAAAGQRPPPAGRQPARSGPRASEAGAGDAHGAAPQLLHDAPCSASAVILPLGPHTCRQGKSGFDIETIRSLSHCPSPPPTGWATSFFFSVTG